LHVSFESQKKSTSSSFLPPDLETELELRDADAPGYMTGTMKLFYTTGFLFLMASSAFANEHAVFARVTVYWAQHQGSTGARLRAGHCAVDPQKIPYGSKVVFPDGPCTAVDTGPAVISRKAARQAGRTASQRNALVIDRYFETKREAMSWANAHPHFMNLRVLPPGSRPGSSPGTKILPAPAPGFQEETTPSTP
jgi:3D (Asp-Asp-Asp) domain-containing protein